MDKLTELWVRACKSENPTLRCQSILRRFYVVDDNSERQYTAIITHLCPIVDKYCIYNSLSMISDLENVDVPFYNDDRTFREVAKDLLISKIRNTKASEFTDLNLGKK